MLGRLGFDFVSRPQEWHQREVNEHRVASVFNTQLPDRLQERQRFNIAHRAADLYHGHVETFGCPPHPILDFISDMRNDLHCCAQVVAAALLGDHITVNPARCAVVELAHSRANEPLIVPEIEIGLRTINSDINFTMLERTHRTRIHVKIRVEFNQSDFQSP